MCRCGTNFLMPVLAIAGLVTMGAAGYRVVSGCGSCGQAEVNAKLVSTTTDDGGSCGLCPGHGGCESAAVAAAAEKEEGCCAAKEVANVKTVAATEVKKDGCCEGEAKAACKEGTQGCTGDGKNGCCGGCTREKATEGSVASSGK